MTVAKKRVRVLLTLVLVVGLALAGYLFWASRSLKDAPSDATLVYVESQPGSTRSTRAAWFFCGAERDSSTGFRIQD
jgi:hypothetical protein